MSNYFFYILLLFRVPSFTQVPWAWALGLPSKVKTFTAFHSSPLGYPSTLLDLGFGDAKQSEDVYAFSSNRLHFEDLSQTTLRAAPTVVKQPTKNLTTLFNILLLC